MALGPELYTIGNALATAPNEVDGITGLVATSALTTMISVNSPTPQDGSWMIETGNATGASARMEVDVVLSDATEYQIEYWAWSLINEGGSSENWVGFVASPFQRYSTTPTKYTHNLTTSGTAQKMRFYNGEIDTPCYIDGLSIKEVLPDPTTTVEIEWIDSVSAAATGNKIYRDDVEIADIGMGVQTYQDDTAETGTTYKYEVQAHDGAGDVTTQEVTGVNVQTITTAS